MKRLGTILFYIGGSVWVAYAAAKYLLDWDVTVRQFLPYHLVTIIPAIVIKRGGPVYERLRCLNRDRIR